MSERTSRLLGVLTAVCVGIAGCVAPAELACGDAQRVRVGMTQSEVQTLLGRPSIFKETRTGRHWWIGYPVPDWVQGTRIPLALFLFPVWPFVELLVYPKFGWAYVEVWFDGNRGPSPD